MFFTISRQSISRFVCAANTHKIRGKILALHICECAYTNLLLFNFVDYIESKDILHKSLAGCLPKPHRYSNCQDNYDKFCRGGFTRIFDTRRQIIKTRPHLILKSLFLRRIRGLVVLHLDENRYKYYLKRNESTRVY